MSVALLISLCCIIYIIIYSLKLFIYLVFIKKKIIYARERSFMLMLLKSLVIPQLEYFCQLWNAWKANAIQAIETIQRTFTYKISEVQHLNYWERLH